MICDHIDRARGAFNFLLMKLYKIRGGTESDLYAKQYNIGVGISLGNKWFSSENIINLVGWSLEHTKEFVVVYVADSLHAINIEVRNRKSPKRAFELARKMGDAVLEEIQMLVHKKFSREQISRIYYARWDDFLMPKFEENVQWLIAKYDTDIDFKNAVTGLVGNLIKDEGRNFSEQDKLRLGTYILAELPELVARIPITGLVYDAYVYPRDSALTEFVEKIQQGIVFPEIKNKIMDTEPKVLLVVR